MLSSMLSRQHSTNRESNIWNELPNTRNAQSAEGLQVCMYEPYVTVMDFNKYCRIFNLVIDEMYTSYLCFLNYFPGKYC